MEVPHVGSLKVARQVSLGEKVLYHMAMGEHYRDDSRRSISQYVCGVEYEGTGATFRIVPVVSSSKLTTYSLEVESNVLSPLPINWCVPRPCPTICDG